LKESSLKTKTQNAYIQLKQSLLLGRLKPGQRLIEAKLCEELGLGRGPVREALLLLHGEGFVRNQGAYRGHIVQYTEDIPPDQLLHRYELREQIGAGACRLAAKNMNGWEIDQLRVLAQEIDDATRRGDRETSYRANYAFHQFLLESCGNALLRDVWESQQLMPLRPRSLSFEGELLAQVGDCNDPSMTDIVDAIATHDQTHAEATMKRRVRKITEALRATVYRYTTDSSKSC
jgi:DNA-binding GntR family transcriptional regulator